MTNVLRKPFRFGLQARAWEPKDWRELAQRCESLGYDALYMADHFDTSQVWSPQVALTVAAEVTERITVGTLVLGNDYRHPALVAKDLASIHLASGERAVLGLGAGWMKVDYDWLGIPYDSPKVRVDRLTEAIDVVKGCWASGSFNYAGEHYTITDYEATPKLERPPTLLIGGGAKRVLSLAGRHADIVSVNPNLRAGATDAEMVTSVLESGLDEKISWVRDAAGDRFDDIELQVRPFLADITDDRQAYAEQAAPGFGVEPADVLNSVAALVGTVDEVCEQLVARRERWGFSNIVIGNGKMEEFAPVVERLAGR